MIEKLGLTQEELAKRLGKSRPHLANHIRLLSLPPKIQALISDGKISMGHGRALLGLRQKDRLQAVAEKIVKDGLNVRQLELLIQQLNDAVPRETKKKPEKDVFIRNQETQLRERFGTTVTIKQSKNKGKIEIDFFSKDDLERILELIGKNHS